MRRFNGVVVVVVAIAMLVGRVWFDDAKNDVPPLRERPPPPHQRSCFCYILRHV